MSQIRVRFAPSPTGYLHIGGARTCLFNWLFARRYGGKLILRIEDTDFERLKENSIEQILDSLKWLGLDWDEGPEKEGAFGPYFQSQRLSIYQEEAGRLVAEGRAYYCFCSSEELEEQRKQAKEAGSSFRYNGRCRELCDQKKNELIKQGRKPVIRIKAPSEGQTVVDDIVRGKVSFENSLIDDIIIVKSNDVPTYNFACVVDDNAMGISHVIRAEEHLSNTPKQVVIYKALGYNCPRFAHVPMILAPDRSKLSKRHGATSVEEFREQGFLAEAISNYLCLLGWSTENQDEIITIEDAVKQFTLERVTKNAAIYDIRKLAWINGNYLKSLDIKYITQLAIPFIKKTGIFIEDYDINKLQAIVGLIREKVWTLAEVAQGTAYFFQEPHEYDQKGIEKYFARDGIKDLVVKLSNEIGSLKAFNKDTLEKAYRSYADRLGIKAADLIHPTRLALTGRTVSPGLFEIMEIMGKDECLKRLAKAISFIEKNELKFNKQGEEQDESGV